MAWLFSPQEIQECCWCPSVITLLLPRSVSSPGAGEFWCFLWQPWGSRHNSSVLFPPWAPDYESAVLHPVASLWMAHWCHSLPMPKVDLASSSPHLISNLYPCPQPAPLPRGGPSSNSIAHPGTWESFWGSSSLCLPHYSGLSLKEARKQGQWRSGESISTGNTASVTSFL